MPIPRPMEPCAADHPATHAANPVVRPPAAFDLAREIVRRANAVAPSPSLLRLETHLRRGDTSARQIGRLIEGSPALAARVLRLANSAFYAPAEPVVSLSRAVVLLGDTVLRQLVLTSLIASRRAADRTPRQALAAARLMGDAVRSAVVCRALAGLSGITSPDDAFSAGLLHDLGHVYLLDEAGDPYASHLLKADGRNDNLARERILTGTTHVHVGVAFAEEWHLPDAIRDVLRSHHAPQPATLGAVVRASDWLVRELNARNFEDPAIVAGPTDAALATIGLDRTAWAGRIPAVRDEYAELLMFFATDDP